MNKEFDVVKVIRSLRNLKAFVSTSLMDKKDKLKLENGHKNVIDLDVI